MNREDVMSQTSVGTALHSSSSAYTTRAFWERLWRAAGIQAVGLFVLGYAIYGFQPQVGASPEALAAFYGGNAARILIASVFFGLAILNLMWFAAALRTTLADAGQDGWGAAASAASSAVGVLFLLVVTLAAGLAYSIAGAGSAALTSGLNDLTWAVLVLSSFPRAMLTMSAAFGLWRAERISNALFAVGVAAVVLTLAGGTTWMNDGVWAPDGAYSRFVSPLIGIAWALVVSRVLLTKTPATHTGW
jgi:hypothetical protein